jgi:hypothetical protein
MTMADDMGDKAVNGDELAVFERLLDAYGGDQARWPADRRALAQALLGRQDAAGRAARRALAEARALDRALAAVPVVDATRAGALAERIVATTRLAPASRAANPNVVALDRTPRRPPWALAVSAMPRGGWAAAALLAASLLIGVFVGPGNDGLPALRDAAHAIGLDGYLDQLALGPPDDGGLQDEDVL